ncbi:PREDICTED: NACHT, LRR and PYD domains-containing protein 7 [Condylura cristata]|uniref:NACHT, LRR and PYD domains-containing protein 7 n=1 Tax=Condylura cristata TaxID=143302 RepID=UPI000643DF16|nr:PREDICTED: NACHT, LRR and PYD domains-containing protein 7 [Condylura cristata]
MGGSLGDPPRLPPGQVFLGERASAGEGGVGGCGVGGGVQAAAHALFSAGAFAFYLRVEDRRSPMEPRSPTRTGSPGPGDDADTQRGRTPPLSGPQGAPPPPALTATLRGAAGEGRTTLAIAWAQTSVLDRDLARPGMKEANLRQLLGKRLLLRGRGREGCESFVHLSVQQFFAAMFCVLEDGPRGRSGEVRRLLSKQERLDHRSLAPVGPVLLGLAHGGPAAALEATPGCRVSPGIAQDGPGPRGERPSSVRDWEAASPRLHAAQGGQLTEAAAAQAQRVAVHLASAAEMARSSSCLRRCAHLRELSLQVAEGLFLEDAARAAAPWAQRSRRDQHVLRLWTDFCSVLSSSQSLSSLQLGRGFLSRSSVRILCERITRATCRLQRLVSRKLSAERAHGQAEGEGELRSLQKGDEKLRRNHQSERPCYLNTKGFRRAGPMRRKAELAGRHGATRLPQRWLGLENCRLTEALCKELAPALAVSRTLTHLCLANNGLGDGGVKRLCEGLSYPECKLQALGLWRCDVTSRGCAHISELLQGGCGLRDLDLGLNPIASGLSFLCEALKKPSCNLKCLGLCGCSVTAAGCPDLASALSGSRALETLDLAQNDLGPSGVVALLDALTHRTGPLKTLRLEAGACSAGVQRLLREVKESNARLTVDCSAAPAMAPPQTAVGDQSGTPTPEEREACPSRPEAFSQRGNRVTSRLLVLSRRDSGDQAFGMCDPTLVTFTCHLETATEVLSAPGGQVQPRLRKGGRGRRSRGPMAAAHSRRTALRLSQQPPVVLSPQADKHVRRRGSGK